MRPSRAEQSPLGCGVPPSTVAREIAGNGGQRNYRAWQADTRAVKLARRPKVPKLVGCPRLRHEVERRLEMRWSPQQIAARLAGQARRRPRRRTASRHGQLPDMVLISDRPAEVADRAVPGHWEGDLVIGKAGGSAIGTLIERHSRYVMLLELAEGRFAEHVRTELTAKIFELPAQLRRSLTWDHGKEMAEHAQLTIDTGIQVYFCDPHSSWQRGSNENVNGLLRQSEAFAPAVAMTA